MLVVLNKVVIEIQSRFINKKAASKWSYKKGKCCGVIDIYDGITPYLL
jgi:hypothetical protein